MADTRQRVVVDGVDFPSLILFPRIFNAVPASLAPRRLLLCLFLFVALLTFGRLWDAIAGPSISPAGLVAGRMSDAERSDINRLFRDSIMLWARDSQHRPAGDPTSWTGLSARQTMGHMHAGYAATRATITDAAVLQRQDTQFAAALQRVHQARPRGPFEATIDDLTTQYHRVVRSATALSISGVFDGLGEILVGTPRRAWNADPWFLVIFGLFFLLAFSIAGGAVCRMAAVQFATTERIRLGDGLDFAVRSWRRLIMAHILPIIVLAFLAGIIIVLGVLMAIPVVDVVGALLYGLALLLGFLFVLCLVVYVAGFSLLSPAVACESCDGAEAMQRSYAYVILRPLHLLWYALIYVIGLALGFILVSLLASLTLNYTADLFNVIAGNPAMQAVGGTEPFDLNRNAALYYYGSWHNRWAAVVLAFWQALVVCIVVAWALAYHFSAASIIYLLMRRAADGQAVDDVWQPEPADNGALVAPVAVGN